MNDGQEGYIAVLHLQLDPLRLELEAWEADSAKLSQVLWVGNTPSNNPQDRLTTDKVGYLVSQTVPNLLARLPKEGRLHRQLKRLAGELYIAIAHALHGKARKLLYASPITGEVLIFDHTPM